MNVVVVIDWKDASGQDGPITQEQIVRLKSLRSCGLLIDENAECYVLSQDYCSGDQTYRGVLCIPKVNATSVHRFVIKDKKRK